MSSARTAERALPNARQPRTVVVGLGNPTRGDDGVGWQVIDALRATLANGMAGGGLPASVELDQLAVGGLTLMEQLVGYERAILVDAICTGNVAPGTVTCVQLAELETRLTGHLDSSHDAGLAAALDAGRALGAPLPDEIVAVAVEARILDDFSDELSPAVEAAVPRAVAAVVSLLEDG